MKIGRKEQSATKQMAHWPATAAGCIKHENIYHTRVTKCPRILSHYYYYYFYYYETTQQQQEQKHAALVFASELCCCASQRQTMAFISHSFTYGNGHVLWSQYYGYHSEIVHLFCCNSVFLTTFS